MDQATEGRTERTVRIETLDGRIEGLLLVSVLLRTQDQLNKVANELLTVHSPVLDSTGWSLSDGPLFVNKSNILFLAELSEPSGGQPERFMECSRAAVRLRVGAFDIEGFVHVSPRGNGDPVLRFNQDTHPFIALTSASVVGPDKQFASPFLAVQRSHVLAVQPMDPQALELATVSESNEVEG